MTLARWQATIVDQHGDIMPGASVSVRSEATGELAAIYSDRAGASPRSNPFTIGDDAFAAFHAAGGAYRVEATRGDVSIVWRYVGVGKGGESDVDQAALNTERDERIAADMLIDAKAQQALDLATSGTNGILPPVVLLTTDDVSPATGMEAGDTYDGVVLEEGWVIAKAKPGSDATNGFWVVQASGAAVRAAYADAPGEMELRTFTVSRGTHAGQTWFVATDDISVIDTTPIDIVLEREASSFDEEVIDSRTTAGGVTYDRLPDRLDAMPITREVPGSEDIPYGRDIDGKMIYYVDATGQMHFPGRIDVQELTNFVGFASIPGAIRAQVNDAGYVISIETDMGVEGGNLKAVQSTPTPTPTPPPTPTAGGFPYANKARWRLVTSSPIYGSQMQAAGYALPSMYCLAVFPAYRYLTSPLAKYYGYYSTDHHAGKGGIAMALADHPLGPWTQYKPPAPIVGATSAGVIYQDHDIAGNQQCETPSWFWDQVEKKVRIGYQIYDASAPNADVVSAQMTFFCEASDGISFTKTPNSKIDWRSSADNAGHAGYFQAFEIGGRKYAYSSWGSSRAGYAALHRAVDLGGKQWSTDPRPMSHWTHLVGGGRISFAQSNVLETGHGLMCVARLNEWEFGTQPQVAKIGMFPIASDLRTPLAEPIVIWEPTLSWETADLRSIRFLFEDDAIYLYYTTRNAAGTIWRTGVMQYGL